MLLYLCTIYDIEANIPELYSKDNDEFTEPLGLILNQIQIQSAIVKARLNKYALSLTHGVSPKLTYPISRKGNTNKNAYLKTPTLLITDSTTNEADTYIVTFTDSTSFGVTNFFGLTVGSGNINTDFTSNNGLFEIKLTDWVGTFGLTLSSDGVTYNGDKFYFAYETHEDILRLICSYLVAGAILTGRYVSEASNNMSFLNNNYSRLAENMLKDIEAGDLTLSCFDINEGGTLESNEYWHGYNVDAYGLGRTPPLPSDTTDRLNGTL
jgi:hypothetical protein